MNSFSIFSLAFAGKMHGAAPDACARPRPYCSLGATAYVAAVFVAATLVNQSALAAEGVTIGHDGGNGGDAVVCFKDIAARNAVLEILEENGKRQYKIDPLSGKSQHIESVELLDLYEASLRRDYQPQRLTGSRDQIMNTIYQQISEKSNFDRILKKWAANYRWYDNKDGVLELHDSNHVILFSENCLTMQMGYQLTVMEDKEVQEVYTDERLEQHSTMLARSQAAFRFHEIILGLYAAKIKAENGDMVKNISSIPVRRFVSYLFSTEFVNDTSERFVARLENLLPRHLVEELRYRAQYEVYGQVMDGYLQWGRNSDSNTFIPYRGSITLNFPFGRIESKGTIQIHDKSTATFPITHTISYRHNSNIFNLDKSVTLSGETGQIYRSYLATELQIKSVVIPKGSQIQFAVDDEIRLTLASPVRTGPFIYPEGLVLEVNKDGNFIGLYASANLKGDVLYLADPSKHANICFIGSNRESTFENGSLASCMTQTPKGPVPPFSQIQAETEYSTGYGLIRFDSDGRPTRGTLAEEYKFLSVICEKNSYLKIRVQEAFRGDERFTICDGSARVEDPRLPNFSQGLTKAHITEVDGDATNTKYLFYFDGVVEIENVKCKDLANFDAELRLVDCISAKRQRINGKRYKKDEIITVRGG